MIEKYDYLLKKKNVNLIYLGIKQQKGRSTGCKSVVVGVKNKIDVKHLDVEDVIPKSLGDGMVTDVVEIGEITVTNMINQKYHRPITGGISIGPSSGAGTLGCIVEKNGKNYGLTNRHVVDPYIKGVKEAIRQPAIMDGGKEIVGKVIGLSNVGFSKPKPIGVFKKLLYNIGNFIFIFKNLILRKRVSRLPHNTVDAAIFSLSDGLDFSNEILGIGKPKGSVPAKIGMKVFSAGRTSGKSVGKVVGVEGRLFVNFPSGKAFFVDQLIINGVGSLPGDSGSIVIDSANRVVGLTFASSSIGESRSALVNPANLVEKEMGFKF